MTSAKNSDENDRLVNSSDKKFSEMSRNELLDYCRSLYDQEGIAALTYPKLKAIQKLYPNLYAKNLSQKTILKELKLEDEYKGFHTAKPYKYGESIRERWTWEGLIAKVKKIQDEQETLPPALWFQKNGYGSLVVSLYKLGHTWDELRAAVGDFSNSNFVESRNGLRWLSHAEASISNFLYARGIEHKKGMRYDNSFAELAVSKYAIYDLHILGTDGIWFDVEVWGDRPNGHNEERYARIRSAKEEFNRSNPHFLGIHHADCYDESKLVEILKPCIGLVQPFKFDKPTDKLLHSTHWSNADELLAFCQNLASTMLDGKFPSEDWLRKRGQWANRSGDAYNTLSVYIKLWLGGTRNLRRLLGQGHNNTTQWNEDMAINAYRDFYTQHALTPNQVKSRKVRDPKSGITQEMYLVAVNIAAAVQKYAGGASKVNDLLGIHPNRSSQS